MTSPADRDAHPPTGEQFLLHHHDQQAVITEIGAGLRSYRIAGTELLDGHEADEPCEDARGQLLIPWPNRVADGRYEWQGTTYQLDITEPELGHAIHGLTRWQPWQVEAREEASITLTTRLAPQPGWPHPLLCRQRYRLDEHGLTSTTTALNIGRTVCPYALGAHPYLRADTATIDAAVVTIPASTYLVNDERLIPVQRQPVAGTSADLRTPTAIGAREIDHAYTDLTRDTQGRASLTLRRVIGEVTVWFDAAFPYLEIYTAHDLPDTDRRRGGLGVEPMTAPPNALRTGEGLIHLLPGTSHTASWGIALTPADPDQSPARS